MGTLTRRIELLERQRQRTDICPGHITEPTTESLRESLRAFSPIAADRAAYRAEQEALADTPACERCGWRPTPIFIQVDERWNWGSPEDAA